MWRQKHRHLPGIGIQAALRLASDMVKDFSPLPALPGLLRLPCDDSKVSDRSQLKDMKLRTLLCHITKVSDLSLLKGMPLIHLRCDFKAERDTEILRSIKTLETINDKPVKEFWKEVDAGKQDKKP